MSRRLRGLSAILCFRQCADGVCLCRAGGFAGQRVIVVGLGNSSGDVCHELIGHASSILLSHNRGAVVVSSVCRGRVRQC
jgi:thioredoxin reductase